MNYKILLGTLLGVSLAIPASAEEITLSPNTNKGGTLPSGYSKITFNMADGNWAPKITLPATPDNGSQVVVKSNAGYIAVIDTTPTDLPLDTLQIRSRESFTFTFRAKPGHWVISGDHTGYYSPNKNGSAIPDAHRRLSIYGMADGNWTKAMNLPATANNGDIAVVRSNATWNSRVKDTNLLYATTNLIKRGDAYAFIYNGNKKRWVLKASPLRVLNADELDTSMPKPTSPRTQVKFASGAYEPKITLPAAAGDRDEVTLTSSTGRSIKVDGSNILGHDSLTLTKGNEYRFKYIAEKSGWQLMK